MKRVFKYSILFFIFLCFLFITYSPFLEDSIVNYGFSYAIRMGEIPYKDFNLVIPLFSPFFYALPLILFPSYITFYATQAILLTILFDLLEKRLSHKVYIFFFFIFLCYPSLLPKGLFPGYNFLFFFILIILLSLEERKTNDYIIGILLGILILTKHTIGCFFFLPSIIFYFHSMKKIGKRILGAFIPISIFLIYLLLTHTLSSFWDLCVLGLFDFANKNHTYDFSIGLIITFIICFISFILIMIKDKKIHQLYLFLTILFIIPIIDDYHLSYFVMATILVILERIQVKENLKKVFGCLCLAMMTIWTVLVCFLLGGKFYFYPTYPFRYMTNNMREDYLYLESFEKKADKDVVLFLLGTENYFYKIVHQQKITYFDLPNYGNYGYQGNLKIKKKIDAIHDSYIVVNHNALKDKNYNQQYEKELAEYIMKNGVLVEQSKHYSVYYKE